MRGGGKSRLEQILERHLPTEKERVSACTSHLTRTADALDDICVFDHC